MGEVWVAFRKVADIQGTFLKSLGLQSCSSPIMLLPMKLIKILTASCIALGFSVSGFAQQPAAPAAPAAPAMPEPAPTFTEPQMLEMFGWLMANRFGVNQLELTPAELEVVKKGINAGMADAASPFDVNKIGPEMQKFLMGKNEAYRAKAGAKAKIESEAYFAKIKALPGVQTTPSGLYYVVVQPGTGDFPKPTDTVTVNYTGKLTNGTVFDSSEGRGPATFPLNGVIPGWTEGLQKINKGGKLKLYIPSALGYGEQGSPPTIPGNATLEFDVELVEIAAPQAEAPAMPMPTAPAGTK